MFVDGKIIFVTVWSWLDSVFNQLLGGGKFRQIVNDVQALLKSEDDPQRVQLIREIVKAAKGRISEESRQAHPDWFDGIISNSLLHKETIAF